MYISKDINEISECIVCPRCKFKSKKDWIAHNVESIIDDTTILQKSRIYFRCLTCKYVTEVFDSRLVKFVHQEIMSQGKSGKNVN